VHATTALSGQRAGAGGEQGDRRPSRHLPADPVRVLPHLPVGARGNDRPHPGPAERNRIADAARQPLPRRPFPGQPAAARRQTAGHRTPAGTQERHRRPPRHPPRDLVTHAASPQPRTTDRSSRRRNHHPATRQTPRERTRITAHAPNDKQTPSSRPAEPATELTNKPCHFAWREPATAMEKSLFTNHQPPAPRFLHYALRAPVGMTSKVCHLDCREPATGLTNKPCHFDWRELATGMEKSLSPSHRP